MSRLPALAWVQPKQAPGERGGDSRHPIVNAELGIDALNDDDYEAGRKDLSDAIESSTELEKDLALL